MSWPLSSIAAIWQICKSSRLELSSKTLCTEHSLNRWVAWNPYLPPSEGNYFEVFWNCCKQEDIFLYIYMCVCIYIFIYFIYKCSKCPLGVHLCLSFQMMTKYLICSISPEKILVREWQFWCTLEWHNHVNACTIKTYELIQSF